MKVELTREQYLKQLASLSAVVNPKPNEEQRQKLLQEYERKKKARTRTQRIMKELQKGAEKHA